MSEDQAVEQSMSQEEKFLGVRTTIGKKPDEDDNFNVEVVDDRPPEDRRPPAKSAQQEDSDDGDDELAGYSHNVKKRINKLRYQQHEERRMREDAERMREEAIRVAQQVTKENQNLQHILHQGEAVLLSQMKDRATLAVSQAESAMRKAVEEGNTDGQIEAQKALNKAQAEYDSAIRDGNSYQGRAQQYAQQQQQWAQQEQQARQRAQAQAQAQAQMRQPSEKALSWAEENKEWFQQPGHSEMTAFAYGVHNHLVEEEGIQADSNDYYDALNARVRTKFPEYFGGEQHDSGEQSFATEEPSSTRRSPSVVVAPSERNNGAKPRKVRLNRTQVALAKRLGLTVEQYANQLLKENQ
jgi:hypothetical protein